MDREQGSGKRTGSRRFIDGDQTVPCPRLGGRVNVHRCYFCSSAMQIVPTMGSRRGWVRCHPDESSESRLERI